MDILCVSRGILFWEMKKLGYICVSTHFRYKEGFVPLFRRVSLPTISTNK
jgi:hypothetical protein